MNRIVATARDVGESGPDTLYGFGLVDAAAAVSADVPLVDAKPMGDLAEWIRLYRRADVEPEAPPTPWVPPTVSAQQPPAVGPVPPSGVLVATASQLRSVGVPLLAVALLAAALVGIAAWAIRRFEGQGRSR